MPTKCIPVTATNKISLIWKNVIATDISVSLSPQLVYKSNISCFDPNSHFESTSTSNLCHHSTDSMHCRYTWWGTRRPDMRDRNNLLRPTTPIFYKNWTRGVSWPKMDRRNPILALSAQKRSQNGKNGFSEFFYPFCTD